MSDDRTSESAGAPAPQATGDFLSDAAGQGEGGTFFGHPRGLATLFFTEMWERFGFYGMRALLVLFMTAAITDPNAGLGFSVERSGAIVGLFFAAVYMASLPGGWVADRLIGQRRAVLYGGIFIALGYYGMALPARLTFYISMVLVVIGTGLLKPNVSTMVGELYPDRSAAGNARRDAGFSIFYMGINLGAFLSPLVAGFIGQKINWHLGFATAGVGMTLGLIQYVLGARHLGDAGLEAHTGGPQQLARNWLNLLLALLGLGLLGALLLGVFHVGVSAITHAASYIITVLAIGYLAFVALFAKLPMEERKRVVVIGLFFVAAAVFWSGGEQAGSSLNLVAQQLTNMHVFGWNAPASWLQSVNPLLIIALAPVFAWIWVSLANRHMEPSSPLKFSFGLILLGASFAVLIAATSLAAGGHRISPLWLIFSYFLETCGELSLSPIGLSAITRLAPQRMVGQMMGIWFMATSLGDLFAGLMAASLGGGAGTSEISASAAHSAFTLMASVAVGAGLLMLIAAPWAKKLIGSAE
ncbi:MAG: peptide MFS transporter [Gemmatimonadota bacterium]|jgi:POT family proton-dependent oligopeptide transporter